MSVTTVNLGSVIGPVGPAGPQGETGADGAPGPNEVSTNTETNITGLLKGNGANVSAAEAGTDFATAGIADSGGSASTGYWVKYDDGTMICYKSTTQRPTISNQAGGMYRSAMISLGSFSQTFSGTPRVKPVMYHNSGYYLLITESNNYNASSAGEAAVFSPTSITGTSGPLMDIGYIAIGRWK